ncbi:hypothetical protein WICPIJ_001158 [Wickerhamomyces pijperi]|uniref:Uncharacterized protein n=1 Tax=Wickerhamomyces pijperi TaxID=599730 RepID=A0A9P8QEB7_WICPI|nr:hypothetical protein WICPIJ_001158 [Wickerhamomyces pijperi]
MASGWISTIFSWASGSSTTMASGCFSASTSLDLLSPAMEPSLPTAPLISASVKSEAALALAVEYNSRFKTSSSSPSTTGL